MAARFVVAIKLITLVIVIKENYTIYISMSHYVKRSKKGRYYTSGKRYSVETYASIFETLIEY